MTTKEKPTAFVTPFGRVSFPQLVVPTAMEDGQKKKYSTILLFPGDEKGLEAVNAQVDKAARDKWGAKMDDKAFLAKLEMPIHDASEKAYDGYTDGWKFARFSSVKKPRVIGQDKSDLEADLNAEEYPDLYAGCWARVSYNVFAWEHKHPKTGAVIKRGVSLGLYNVQKVKDGESFGGGHSDADEDFDEIEIDADAAALLE